MADLGKRESGPESDHEEEAMTSRPTRTPMDDDEVLCELKKRRRRIAEYNYEPHGVEEEEDPEDYEAWLADRFRRDWNDFYGIFGSFEDTTLIPPMRFTDNPPPGYHGTMDTLQIFVLKVKETRGGLRWPLHVYGIVAVRDFLDHNRNIIFSRSRDDCQTITQEFPYLQLTGPSRAIVFLEDPTFEVTLKVKGITESEDKDLSHLASLYHNISMRRDSRVVHFVRTSKLSTLELIFGHIVSSVEATISLGVKHGSSWPDGLRGFFAANTKSIDDFVVLLLAFGDGKPPVDADDMMVLTRRVASVEFKGELQVSVKAARLGIETADRQYFKPMKSGKSYGTLKIESCEIVVTVAWSTFSYIPLVRGKKV